MVIFDLHKIKEQSKTSKNMSVPNTFKLMRTRYC